MNICKLFPQYHLSPISDLSLSPSLLAKFKWGGNKKDVVIEIDEEENDVIWDRPDDPDPGDDPGSKSNDVIWDRPDDPDPGDDPGKNSIKKG